MMIFVAVLGLLILCAYVVYKQVVMEYIAGERAVFHYTRFADFSWNKLIFKTDKYVWYYWTL